MDSLLKLGMDIGLGMPTNRRKEITDDEYLQFISAQLKVEHGRTFFNGLPAISEKGEPLAVTQVVDKMFRDRNWVDTTEAPPDFKSLAEIIMHLEKQGISPNGEKGAAFIAETVKRIPNLKIKP